MNKTGAITKATREWGSKARKEEDDLRGINNRARRQTIAEQLDDLLATDAEYADATDAANCWDDTEADLP